MAALKAGKTIKYSGASGPCVFTPIGDIIDCKFRFNQVTDGAFKLEKTDENLREVMGRILTQQLGRGITV